MTGDWLDIGWVDEIPVRGSRTVQVAGGDDIAVFRTAEGKVFALLDRCPHKHGRLEPGDRPWRRGRLPAAQLADQPVDRRGAGRRQGLHPDRPGQDRRRPRPHLPREHAEGRRLMSRSGPHHLRLLRRRLRHPRDGDRRARGSDRGRPRPSRQPRQALLEGHASRRDRRAWRAACSIP